LGHPKEFDKAGELFLGYTSLLAAAKVIL